MRRAEVFLLFFVGLHCYWWADHVIIVGVKLDMTTLAISILSPSYKHEIIPDSRVGRKGGMTYY